MSTTESPEIPEFPPKSGQILNDYKLEECLKSSSNCVVFVCHHISDSCLKFVTKIGIKSEAYKLSNEIKFYKELDGGNGIPYLIYSQRFVKRRFFVLDNL